MEGSSDLIRKLKMAAVVAGLLWATFILWQLVKVFVFSTPEMPALAANVPQSTREQLVQQWPKLLETCPGLASHYDSLQFMEAPVYAAEDATGPDDFWAIYTYTVPNGSSIPKSFRAYGHTCRFRVSNKDQTVTIQKWECQSLCLGKVAPNTGSDLTLQLR